MRYWGRFIQILMITTIYAKCHQINWNGNWAHGCYFKGFDIKNVYSTGDRCGPICVLDNSCTHFYWREGVCHLKAGPVKKSMAFSTGDDKDVCGVLVAE